MSRNIYRPPCSDQLIPLNGQSIIPSVERESTMAPQKTSVFRRLRFLSVLASPQKFAATRREIFRHGSERLDIVYNILYVTITVITLVVQIALLIMRKRKMEGDRVSVRGRE